MEELLYQYNPWWEEIVFNKEIKPRERYLGRLIKYLDNKQIISLTCLRRVGKTTLMKLIIKELIKNGTSPNRSITLEIKPLDLEEYIFFKGIKLKKHDKQLYKSYFLDYIKDGGLPENVLDPNREYLMNLVDDIIQKDI